jgi:hypothetical protein
MSVTTPADAARQELGAGFGSGLIGPDDGGYEQARALFNAMIDRRPALIARCSSTDDVAKVIAFARAHDLPLAVRGGGHNGGGLGSVDDGLVIDLSGLKGVRVDPDRGVAEVAGGSVMGDIDHATHPFGLATPSGIISTTGVGIILGGGIGHQTRKYGLSIDNILGADVVLADGSLVRADENQNEDLYWAIRGGGGNYGVVTSLSMKLNPMSMVAAGPILWPIELSADVLSWYREFILNAPEDLNGFFAFLTVPPAPPFPEELHLKKMCGVVWCWTGDLDDADEALAEARAQPGIALDGIQPMPFPILQSAFDGLYPHGDQWYWRADFVEEIPDEAVAKHVEFGEQMPTWKSTMHLYPIDGAAHRVGPTDTPWAYRNANWGMVMAGVDPEAASADALGEWCRGYWEALHPYSAGGAYVNMMMEEGQERVEASYGENYARLAQIKAKYDPDNFFHVNQNIRPAS